MKDERILLRKYVVSLLELLTLLQNLNFW